MIRLSLIIATYNRSGALLDALASVVRQDADPAIWECVVVDNNSSDDTAARFAEFAANHPSLQLRCVRESRQGLSHARNRGIAETTGEYIAIIDDDERINEGFVSAYIDLFDRYAEASAAGGRIIPDYPSGRPAWMSSYTERPIANPIDLGDRVREFPAGRIPGGGNMALRRSAIERCGAFDPALGRVGTKLVGGEESDLFERFARAGERCYYVPGAVMWHIIPPSKLTADYFRRLCFNIGVTQRTRAAMRGALAAGRWCEMAKWGATLLLAAGYLVTLRPQKAFWLMRMRRHITRGWRG